jgi:hypothetical protein
MIRRLLDPWFLLELHETLCWALLGIVILGIAAECVCMLLLFIGERRQPSRVFDGRIAPMLSNR